jgi:hypothetical protein
MRIFNSRGLTNLTALLVCIKQIVGYKYQLLPVYMYICMQVLRGSHS